MLWLFGVGQIAKRGFRDDAHHPGVCRLTTCGVTGDDVHQSLPTPFDLKIGGVTLASYYTEAVEGGMRMTRQNLVVAGRTDPIHSHRFT
jgi:hypothetical protein